jgi:pimeloyl-ACP methyl ester carboxylesterase
MARLTIRLVLLLFASLPTATLAPATDMTNVWTVIAVDPKGDARAPQSADAAQLSYRYDTAGDMLWFRITLFRKPDTNIFTVTIAVDTAADGVVKTNWQGANHDFTFDKLISAELRRVGRGYQGAITLSDATARNGKPPIKRSDSQVRVEGDSIIIGFRRLEFTDKMKMNLIAAVGPRQEWDDEIPSSRSATLDLSAARPSRGLREIDVSRNNLRFAPGDRVVADADPPQIVRQGRGATTLILVPGVYSGHAAFDGFIARHASDYTFYVVTPPGLGGTVPRQLPPETTSYREFTWTRRLERDILDLIERRLLDKPILVTHGFPGSLAAEELALSHPERLGGIVEIASMPAQSIPSLRDPNREVTPDERIAGVDESWGLLWFRYVTPETWESNNYQADMFANDPDRAERARQQVEAAPLPVKIRYLSENMAWDRRADLGKLDVPVLALRPGFNEQLLAQPALAWFRSSFLNAWDGIARNPRFELITIPNARALILDDQPALADRAIAAFVERNAGRR